MQPLSLLWRRPDGTYYTTPFGIRTADIYIGSHSQLVTRYRERGHDWFTGKLPGLPEEILTSISERAALVDRAAARLDAQIARQREQDAVWAD